MEPKTIGETFGYNFGLFLQKTREYFNTPQGRAQAEKAKAYSEQNTTENLVAVAKLRGCLLSDDILPYALLPLPQKTNALEAVISALAWRLQRQLDRKTSFGVPLIKFILGPKGVGKTVALTWAIVHHKREALFTSAPEIAKTPQEQTVYGEKKRHPFWEKLATVDLLAITELGLEKGTPETIVELLMLRWENGLATILDGNLNSSELKTRYLGAFNDGRLIDRLAGQKERGLRPIFEDAQGVSYRKATTAATLTEHVKLPEIMQPKPHKPLSRPLQLVSCQKVVEQQKHTQTPKPISTEVYERELKEELSKEEQFRDTDKVAAITAELKKRKNKL